MLKFSELLKLMPDEQEVFLIFSDYGVIATKDAMECLLVDEACEAKVTNIEADSGRLKVWVEGK